MKRVILTLALMGFVASAQSVDIGINTTHDYSGKTNRDYYGVTVGQKYGKMGVTAGYDSTSKGAVDQARYSLIGSIDVTKVGPVQLAVKAGGSMIDNDKGKDGYALLAGIGAEYPVTKTVAATVDYRHQMGQSRVSTSDGNSIIAGMKVSF